MMNLPKPISNLIEAQNNFDSLGYANCFSGSATVADEGKTYKGRTEIFTWIEKASLEYKATMKPIEYSETEKTLKAEISGSFPGSPVELTFHFTFSNELIQSLKII